MNGESILGFFYPGVLRDVQEQYQIDDGQAGALQAIKDSFIMSLFTLKISFSG